MSILIQAIVMGIVQGLTEFLPVSSSGHLIIIPALLGWKDPFIDSLVFSVMLHMGTLLALLVYFRVELIRLVLAWLASIRDRSLADDPERRLAWLLVASTIPAVIAGILLNDLAEKTFRSPTLVAIMLVIGAVILWLAERLATRSRSMLDLDLGAAIGIGVAQALALVPGISRSGISISAGLYFGLEREAAARYSFLMATPIVAGAGLFELRKVVTGEAGVDVALGPLIAGMVAALVAGLIAIAGLLRFLRTNPTTVFVVYRLLLAAVVLVVWLGLWNR